CGQRHAETSYSHSVPLLPLVRPADRTMEPSNGWSPWNVREALRMQILQICTRSVCQDLGQEVLGPISPRVGEELVGGVLLDDLAAGHEDHAVRRPAGEPHLMGDDHH